MSQFITLLTLLLVSSLGWADPTPALVSVPVLKEAVGKGTVLTAAHLNMLEVPASQVFASTLTDPAEVVGQQAVRPLLAGAPLSRLHLRVPPAVSRGSNVTFRFQRGGIELTGQGQALEDGAIGSTIKVTNPATRATLMGTVQADQTVQLN